MMCHSKYTAIAILSFIFTSCSNTDSGYVDTNAINADFDVSSNGSQSNLIAQLKVGDIFSNNVLELSDGDQLVAYNGSRSIVMSKDSSIFGDVKYRATFSGDLGGTQYTITFNRPSSNEVINSSVTLPDDFTILSTYSGTYTDADSLYISWNQASSYSTTISLNGLCGFYTTSIGPGATNISIPLSVVHKVISGPSVCTMTIGVSRNVRAPVNGQFGEGGHFDASQKRSSSFQFSYSS